MDKKPWEHKSIGHVAIAWKCMVAQINSVPLQLLKLDEDRWLSEMFIVPFDASKYSPTMDYTVCEAQEPQKKRL